MSNPMGDRNLLVGILAWQQKFISRTVVAAALSAWTQAKEKGLGQILREQKALTENQHALLEEAVHAHLLKHGNDAKKGLAALKSVDPLKQELAKIADADLQASLAQVATARPKVKPAAAAPMAPMVVEEVIEVEEAPKKKPTPVKPIKIAPKQSAAAALPVKKPAGGIPMGAFLLGGAIIVAFVVLIALTSIVIAVVVMRDDKPIAQVKPDDPVKDGKIVDKGGDKPAPIKDPAKKPPLDPDPPIDPMPPELPPKPAPPAVTEGFVALFNGKDLTGWKPHLSRPDHWRVEDGILVGSGHADSYLTTPRADYRDFHLRAEVRTDERSVCSVTFRTTFDRGTVKIGERSIDGYRTLVSSKNSGAGIVGNLQVWGKSMPSFSTMKPLIAPQQWITLEVLAQGKTLTVKIDGKTTATYEETQDRFTAGRIFIRQEFQGIVEFRKIEIKELKSDAAPPIVVAKDFVPLFNGKDLTGWRTHPTQPGDWRVKDGILVGSGAALDTLYTTRADYKDFHLRVEARINEVGRGAVFCRGPFGPVQPAANPLIPIGFQTEIYNGAKELNRTGGVSIRYMTGTSGRNAQSRLASGEWFTLEVIAAGNGVSTKVNGQPGSNMVDQDRIFMSGTIGLFLERAGTVLEFRKIEIKELEPVVLAPLPPKEPPGKDAAPFAAEEGFVSLFNGQDLTGWKVTGRENWRVVNGVLTGSGGANLRFLATPRDDYGDFHLRLEARLNDDGNATVAFRYPYGVDEIKNIRIGGYALRLTNLPTDLGKTGSLMVHEKTGIRNLMVKERLVPPGTWFNLEVIAKGNQVDVLINGQQANSFLNPQTHLMGGRIVLGYADNFNRQTVVEYRKIEIKEFKAVAAPPQPVPPRPLEDFAPIFNGKDLTGWRVKATKAGR